MNLPDYNFLSAPLWLVTILHVVTLTLHFLAMNFVVGGVIILLFGRFSEKWNHPTVGGIIKQLPNAMAATITLGVAPLLFVQLVYADQVYSASIVSAWFWLMIALAAIIVYYFLYASSFAVVSGGRRLGTYLTVALIGLLYISLVYSSVFSLAEHPELYLSLYAGNQSGLVLNTDFGSYLFRWLHMLLGALTVGGFFVALLGRDDQQAYGTGKTFYLWGMAAAMVLGLIYLFTLGDYILPLMRSPAVWVLVVAIVLSLLSLHFVFKKRFVWSGLMLAVSLLGMVFVRHTLRLLLLEGKFDPAAIAVRPQWSVFVVFLICFLLAIALVWYMLKLFFGGRGQPV
ncbi:MAG: hypothetical protein JSW34_06855 [Candidatus Zixiibacteriota bacterium]|nr:MAG: hypothetical protein JSW34_06855 [candidate division Zixibacteria bacterium]